jgi:hypothetical protein
MDNLEKVAKAGVNLKEMSAEEKQVVESLSKDELDTLLKVRVKYDALIEREHKQPVSSLKIL